MELKTYTLDDGSVWNAESASAKIGCSTSCARQRLKASTDPDYIFRSIDKNCKKKEYKKKVYTLTEDGKDVFTGTAREVAIKWGLCEPTVYHRLQKSRVLEFVTKKPNTSNSTNKKVLPPMRVSELVKSRNFFDPLSRLLLKTI